MALIEVMVGGLILLAFALAAASAMTVMNRSAATTRNRVAAQSIIRGLVQQTLAAEYVSTTSSPLLTVTANGTDVDGDGEGDGEIYMSNVPVTYQRDTLVSGEHAPALTGTIYRHCTTVDSTLKVVRVTFLLRYTYRGRAETYRTTIFRAQDR